MKLKLVVASMSILGLIISPQLFAETQTKHTKKQHHRKIVKHTKIVDSDYKDMGSLPIQPVGVDAACSISEASLTLDQMTQNAGRALPNPCNPGWFNRIQLSGGINVDLGKWGSRRVRYMGENYQRLSLNDAYINLSANVNEWAKGFASISYNTATINDFESLESFRNFGRHVAEYNAAYSNNVNGGSTNALQLEQAFMTIGNPDIAPVFVQIGKQFQDFGRYQLHAITESLTTVMTKTVATSAKVGFISNGFNGSISVFDDPISKIGSRTRTTNYGAALGFEQPCDQLGWGVGVGYLYNIIGVNDIAYRVNQFNLYNEDILSRGFHRHASGYTIYGDVNNGPFSVSANWVGAQRFNVNDLPRNGVADLDSDTGIPLEDTRGAKPWSAGIQVGYNFEGWDYFGIGINKNQNVYLTYQTSHQAAGLGLPKHRWGVGVGVDWVKNTNFGLEWDHDKAYSVSRGGFGKNSNLVTLRAGIQFA